MNNENKEFFSNDVESNISENEIVLAPPTELIEEAKEIAQNTKSDEKFPFALQYDANQKDFLLSMLETVGAIVEDDDEDGHMLATMMNMTQLAFIKRLDCVERVISKDLYAMSKNKDKEHYEMNLTNTSQNDIMDNTRAYNNESKSESTSLLLSEGTLKSVNANTICSDCESSNSMETAIQISIGATKYGCICCPGCEVW